MTGDNLLDTVDSLELCRMSLNGMRTLLEDANTDAQPEMGAGVWAVTDLLDTNERRVAECIERVEAEISARRNGAQGAR